MNCGLTEETLSQINEVFAHFPEVEKAVLYGSRAKGNYKNGSDVDLTLIGDGVTQRTLSHIQSKLDDSSLPYHFDLSVFSEISHQELLQHIQRVGVIFYQRKN